jgi:hypothetical protein
MNKIKIEKDIIVEDQYGVQRQVWLKGEEVEPYVYNAVLSQNKAINPEDLPVQPSKADSQVIPSLHNNSIENKMLDEEPKQDEPKEEAPQEPEIADDKAPVEDKPKTRKKRSAKPKKG